MWALKWTLAKLALRQLDPVSITLFPTLGAILLLLPLLRKRLKAQPAYGGIIRKEALEPANLGRFFLLGAAGQVAANVLTSWGLKYVPATDAALIGLGTPIVNAILAVVFVGEAFTWRLVPGFAFALTGVLLITGINLHTGAVSNWHYLFGVLLFFAATLGAAFYNAYSKKLLGRFEAAEILFYSYIVAALGLYPFHVALEQPLSLARIAAFHWQTWCAIALMALLVYGLSMVLFLQLLTRRSLAPVSISIYLMTVFGVLISTTTLHEPLTGRLVAGGLLVLLGTIFANLGKPATQRAA
jgi:drug/metabolite transporter (DMT)-like permease